MISIVWFRKEEEKNRGRGEAVTKPGKGRCGKSERKILATQHYPHESPLLITLDELAR